MSEELYDLYKSDPDYHGYVERFRTKHHLGVFEALACKVVQEYGEWLMHKKEDMR